MIFAAGNSNSYISHSLAVGRMENMEPEPEPEQQRA